tara:strand:+ start:1457 stop:1645 length:189 start_codon:yes stop_codon:yes gene_type:complete
MINKREHAYGNSRNIFNCIIYSGDRSLLSLVWSKRQNAKEARRKNKAKKKTLARSVRKKTSN